MERNGRGDPTVLILPRRLLDDITAHVRAAAPNEACGLLIGRHLDGPDGAILAQVEEWVPAANRHPQPDRHFELDPAAHFAVLRRLRDAAREGAPQRLLGHLHSHPATAARPSPRDLAMAHDPDLLWLILGPVIPGAPIPATAWRLTAGPAFAPLVLRVEL